MKEIFEILRLFFCDLFGLPEPGSFKKAPEQDSEELAKPEDPNQLDDTYKKILSKTEAAVIDPDADDDLLKPADEEEPPVEELIHDEDYWWCFPGHPVPKDMPVFELVDDYRVSEELEKKILKGEFPVIEIPTNVMQAMQILNNPNFIYNEVASLINHSPALTGEFIKTVNSSFFSRGVMIKDLKTALPRLGKDNIKLLLYMYSSKLSFHTNGLFNSLATEIVNHSYVTALICGYLSQRYYPDPESAFLAGLMHDIGKLGILKAITDTYPLPKKFDFEVTEELFDQVFPGLHEKAGCFLALNWKLDNTIIDVIEHHHNFADFPFDEDQQESVHLCNLVSLADIMARMLGKGRRIEATNIFHLGPALELNMEKNIETVEFLENIPQFAKI